MQSGAVIEGLDVVEDGSARFGLGGEAAMINQLVFEATAEGLYEGVVIAVIGPTQESRFSQKKC